MKPTFVNRIAFAQARTGCGTARIIRHELDEIRTDMVNFGERLGEVTSELITLAANGEMKPTQELIEKLTGLRREVGQ